MSAVLEQSDLPALNASLERTDPEKIVAWAVAQFGGDLVMSSSFGVDSAVLLHMAAKAMPNIRVIFVDTGYIFAETFQFMDSLKQRLGLNVLVYRTRNDPAEYLKRAGEDDPTWRKNVDACCHANKNEPFERAMHDLKPLATMQGIRRNQSPARSGRHFVEWSPRYNCYSVSPLLNWMGREIHEYLKKHGLPRHPLYEKGYLSVGCNPLSCTRPAMAEDDPRAGRWAGQDKVECGINIINSLDSANL